jgi:hypothetical protein
MIVIEIEDVNVLFISAKFLVCKAS